MLDFETIERDRAARRAHWRALGVYTDRSYAEAIRDGVQAGGGQKLIFHSRTRPLETVTVAEVNDEAERIARGFHKLGLRCGDYLAVMLPTWRETALAYLAAFKIGLAVVPIVPVYGAREIGFVMRETRAKALIVPDRWRGFDYLERVQAAGDIPNTGPGGEATGIAGSSPARASLLSHSMVLWVCLTPLGSEVVPEV